MNTHLHFHLLQTIIDFEPFYSFWCFPYERLNGVLGSYATNHHSVCPQIMKTFKIHQCSSPSMLEKIVSPAL